MGKKSNSKPSSAAANEEEEELTNSPDIFKFLFGREAREEEGLGLGLAYYSDNPTTNDDIDSKKKKKKKREKSNLDPTETTIIGNEEEPHKVKKKKKEAIESIDEEEKEKARKKKKKDKRKKEENIDSDLVVTTTDGEEEVKKRKKKDNNKDTEIIAVVQKDLEEAIADLKEKRKKKRKRDELEEAYEAKTYGVVANVDGKDEDARKVGEKRKTRQDPTEMMVSKEGFDDENKLLRTVFVGNLPLKLKKKALLKEFSMFGEVDSVRIRSVPIVDSKTPRKGAIMKGKINESVDSVNAYIVFKDEKSAQASLSHNMTVVGGNHIRVDKACPPRKKMKANSAPVYDNQKTVFVGNLPFDVKDEEIYQLFCGNNQFESDIEAVRVIRDPNSSAGKGIAYVLFKTKEAANLVIKKRHLKIRDRNLRLYHAKSDAAPSKKRNLPTTSADNSSRKRLAVTSSGSHQDKNKTKTSLSYQGLKASKSNQTKEGQKKDGFRPRTGDRPKPKSFRPRTGDQGKQKSRTASGAEVKQRKNKRPSVAARKEKALKGVGASRQTGVKRKPESHTPDSFHRNKKARKLK